MAHIIQLTTFFHPVHGGVEQIVQELSEELILQGHRVTVFCSDSTREKKRVDEKSEKLGKIKIKRFRTLLSITQFYKVFPGYIRELYKTKFDVVHVHGWRKLQIYPALIIAKLKKKKIVVTTHNPFSVDKNSRNLFLRILIKLHDLTLGKLFCRHIDSVICITRAEIPNVKAFKVDEDRIYQIPNSISKEMFKVGKASNFIKKYNIPKDEFKHRLLWIGRLHDVKGLEYLETAVQQLPEVLFMLIGPDDNAAVRIKKLYKRSRNVMFPGPIKHHEVIHALKSSDLFLLPSKHESFGVVLLEAMAQGIPIISTNKGGPNEIINSQFGITQNPCDQWAWLFNIKKLLKDKSRREKMSIAAKQEAKKYLWKNLIDEYLKVYRV